MIFAEEHPRNMRRHQADKADWPDKGHRKRRQNADPQQRGQAQTANVNAKADGPVLAQPQGGQLPRAAQRQGHHQRQGDQQDGDFAPGGAIDAAHGPEHQPLQRVFVGDELQHRDQSVKGKDQRDAEQNDAGGGHLGPAGDAVQQQGRQQGEDKGVGRDKPLAGNTGQANTEHNRQRGAKRRSRGDAEGKRAGQRVIEDGLHFGAGQSQRQTDDNRHHRIGQADIPDDGARARIGAGRIG